MKPHNNQASEWSEEISLDGSTRGSPRSRGAAGGGGVAGAGVEASEASDEISGVFRFLCDYRLSPPSEWSSTAALSTASPSQSVSRAGVSQCGDVSETSSVATGASIAPSRGVGAPHHTPMGSTTKLIADKARTPSRGWRCLPGFGSVMVALSLTVSLANILRLPTAVMHHGQGSFLLVYVVVTVVFGIPLVFLEILLGQFCQEGTTKLWRAVPLFKGIGFLKVLVSIITAVYYPVIMAIAMFFAVWSAREPLPFAECKYLPYQSQLDSGRIHGEVCLEHTLLMQPDQDPTWFGVFIAFLFTVWALLMVCLSRNERSYRISAFCLLACVLAVLGALVTEQLAVGSKGLSTLLEIDINYILKFDTWYFAVVQMFFSTQIGFGNITTISGRIYAKSNAFWITLTYMFCNLVVGITFTSLVYMWMACIEDKSIIWSSPKIPELFVLSFLYDIITRCFTYDNQLWAAISFLAVVFAGLTSLMAMVFTVTTTIIVECKERWRPWIITAGVSSICFLAGIICLLPERLELVHMLEHYVVSRLILMATAIELIGFVWIYGSHHLYNDFEFVLGYKLNFLWKIIWFIAPVLIIILEVWSIITWPLNSGGNDLEPEWLYLSGWCIVGGSWLFVLIVAIWQIVTQVDYNIWQLATNFGRQTFVSSSSVLMNTKVVPFSCPVLMDIPALDQVIPESTVQDDPRGVEAGKKFLSSLKPSRNWGPVDPIQRHGWVVWRDQCTLSGERDFTLKRRGTRDYTHSVRHSTNEPLGSRYYPHYTKPVHDEKTSIQHTLNSTYTKNQMPNYSSTEACDLNVRGVGAPYIVQLPQSQASDHVCWRKDITSRTS